MQVETDQIYQSVEVGVEVIEEHDHDNDSKEGRVSCQEEVVK